LSYLANTDRQTDKVWQKHNLLGGGNNASSVFCLLFIRCSESTDYNKFCQVILSRI